MAPPPGLLPFILRAKAATWLNRGPVSLSYRLASHDLQYREDDWAYLDSYFGGTDFLGQEIVYKGTEPVWAMNYYGRILRLDQYDGARAAGVTVPGRGGLYRLGRFLGAHQHITEDGTYSMRAARILRRLQGVSGLF